MDTKPAIKVDRSRGVALAAYQSVATHGGVAAADAHGLVLMLLDGAIERLARLRIAVQERDYPEKARVANRIFLILDELQRSIDFDAGGELARNLNGLYDYCSRLLLKASVSLKTEHLDEMSRLLVHLRATWVAAQPEARR